MGFDGFIVPDWFKPMAGWVVGMDWPEGDESRCFRLADACAASARRVAKGDPASGGRTPGEPLDGPVDWDGEALKAFAEHVRRVSGGKQAVLVDQLVAAALEFNGAGVQVEYIRRMIEVSVWFLLFQILWLARAALASGGLTLGLVGARVQLARLTVRQIAIRGLFNIGLFGALVGGMDLGVQASQSRRDAIDWDQFLMSVGTGMLTGGLLTGLSGGLSRLSTSGLRAGLTWAEMTAAEKWLATATRSMAGMMAQSGLANGAATAVSLTLSGQFDWEMVLKGTTAGVVGAADAHWAGMTPTGRGPDSGGPNGGGSPNSGGPDGSGGPNGGGPDGGRPGGPHDHDGFLGPDGPNGAHQADMVNGPANAVDHAATPAGPSNVAGQVPNGARPDLATSLAQAVPDSLARAVPDMAHADGGPVTRPGGDRIDSLINRNELPGAAPQQAGPVALHHTGADAGAPSRPAALRDHGKFAESMATGTVGPREPLRSGTETVKVEAVTLGDGTPAGDAPAQRNPPPHPSDADGRLGRSVDSGVRHARTVEGSAIRLEIVAFGDGTSAIRFTGRDADAAEAAALVRQALGLDGPAIHRTGDAVYQDYGNTALRRSVETGIRDSELLDLKKIGRLELVTFNDGARAFRREYEKIADADYEELRALPPLSIADGESGIHRASETVVYENRVTWAVHEAMRPLVWSESPTESLKRSLYNMLTLGESFHRHVAGVDHLGRPALKIDRDFTYTWKKSLIYKFVEWDTRSPGELASFTLKPNELGKADIAAVSARLEAIRPEFERRGLLDWHDDLMDRLGHIVRHADGDQPALGDLNGVPRHAEGDGHVVDHHAAPPSWPHNLAGTGAHEALAHVLQGDNLRELNEAAAGRTMDSGDAARAQAYAELADAALARLPHRDGTVQTRVPVDWIPADIAPGRELTFKGFLDGVDDPSFLPEAQRSAHLIIRGDHALVDGVSGRPHHVMFGADSRFKLLASHVSSYGVESYFLVHVPEGGEVALPPQEGGHPKARPELTGELRRHFDEHREETRAGVWYRDLGHDSDKNLPNVHDVSAMDGAFYVDGHGNKNGFSIGRALLTADEMATLLLNEPGLRPDDVIYLGNCRVGQGEASVALQLARRTGHVVIAADSIMRVNEHGDMTPINNVDDTNFLSGRGGLRIFLPDDPIPGRVWARAKSLPRSWYPEPESLR